VIPCRLRGCNGSAAPVYRLDAFTVVRCDRCGLMSRDPLPTPADLGRMYDDPAYHASAYFSDSRTAPGSRHPEIEIYDVALERLGARHDLRADPRRPTILDVGCGNGAFLNRAAARGWTPTGVELSRDLAASARERYGLEIVEGDFATAELPSGPYDAMTMWDFLEHVVDPAATLDRARDLLAPDGILVVFTIDSSSLFNSLGALAYHATLGACTRPSELLYDERHCFYFTSATLSRLLATSGFRTVHRRTFRAHLSRWLSRPVSLPFRLASEVIDRCSTLVRRPYRQLLFCQAA
jgi:2-polyprenyl-3-methyl-5-hydroxy-6-metoxy-1,4-benzoquinol methylase